MPTTELKNARGEIAQGLGSQGPGPSLSVAPLATKIKLVVQQHHYRFCDKWYTLHPPLASSTRSRPFHGNARPSRQIELSFSCCVSQSLGASIVSNSQALFLGRSETSYLALLRTLGRPLLSVVLMKAGQYRNET